MKLLPHLLGLAAAQCCSAAITFSTEVSGLVTTVSVTIDQGFSIPLTRTHGGAGNNVDIVLPGVGVTSVDDHFGANAFQTIPVTLNLAAGGNVPYLLSGVQSWPDGSFHLRIQHAEAGVDIYMPGDVFVIPAGIMKYSFINEPQLKPTSNPVDAYLVLGSDYVASETFAVPEPSDAALLSATGGLLLLRRQRRGGRPSSGERAA